MYNKHFIYNVLNIIYFMNNVIPLKFGIYIKKIYSINITCIIYYYMLNINKLPLYIYIDIYIYIYTSYNNMNTLYS